jgi:serpin B
MPSRNAPTSREWRVCPVKLGVAEHAADLQVNESGTVAAAVTGLGAYVIASPRISPARFDANKPFLFFLRDDDTGAVLFAGRVQNAATAQD